MVLHAKSLWIVCYIMEKTKTLVWEWRLVANNREHSQFGISEGSNQFGMRIDWQLVHRDQKGGEYSAYNGHEKGKGVKIHFSVDENGLPLSMLIGRGNEHDSIRFQEVADEIRINIRRGRPRTKPALINADASYDSYSIRQYLRKRGIKCNIPVNKRNRKRPQIGRPPRLDQDTYRNRVVYLNHWKGTLNVISSLMVQMWSTSPSAIAGVLCIHLLLPWFTSNRSDLWGLTKLYQAWKKSRA